MSGIHAKDLSFRYESGRDIVQGLNFEIPKAQFVSLLGSSGSGKSTLLRLFAGLLQPSSGSVKSFSERAAFVFQEPRLLPWRSVRENVELPLELLKQPSTQTEELLRQVGLWEARDLFPHQLSGGMKQRAAIARALITNPEILFLDEPFSALDEVIRESLQELLLDLWKKRGMTMVFVTHSIAEAVFLSERVLLLSRGKFIADESLPIWDRQPKLRTEFEFHQKVSAFSALLRKAGGVA